MRPIFRLLDSVFVSRVGNVGTLIRLVVLGALLVVAVGLVGAQVVDVAGWMPLVCFVVWSALALLLATSWMVRQQSSTLSSPAEQIVMRKGLPRSSVALLNALVRAESRGREFIARAAILNPPVDNQESAADLARSYAAYEAEVAALLRSTNELDDRWRVLWAHKPSWYSEDLLGPLLEPPFYGEKLEILVRYMALRTRQLDWMIEFLQGGSDEPVRYVRIWAAIGQKPQGENATAHA